ncbi:MAG: hypothetical protein KKB13_00800 [Chloroflexi bacterium]|nr:hypothetical protein [Chloroflexota bacterium]
MKQRLVLAGLAISIMALVTACLPSPSPAPTMPPEPTAIPVLPTATAAATAVVEPTTGPEPAPTRINLDAGSPTATESGTISVGGMGQYVVALQAGQTIQAQVSAPQGQVVLVVYGADGMVLLSDHVGATNWQGQIPTTQDYHIDLKSTASGAINYTFQVSLSAQPQPSPQPTTKRIQFQSGATSAIEQGSLAAGGRDRYVLKAMAGQIMSVSVSSSEGNVILVIWGADGTVLISDHAGTTHWSGTLPSTQDYYIDCLSVGGDPANYTLQVTIPPGPHPQPQPTVKRISFAPGATTAVEHGTVAAGSLDRYVLKAMAGQTMSVNITSYGGQVILVIWGADGTVLISDHAGTTHWSGTLPSTQDYYIDCKSGGNVDLAYTLQVTIPPQPGPQPTVKRITFAPGSTTAVEYGNAAPNTSARYVLKAMAGQTMNVSVSTSQGEAILVIWGADGTVLISDHAGATTWSGPLPSTQDYYISVQSVGSAAAAFELTVNIPPA